LPSAVGLVYILGGGRDVSRLGEVVQRIIYVLILFAGIIATIQTASAQSPWYIEGSAGALLRYDASSSGTFVNSVGATAPGTNTFTYSPGYVLNLGVGYKLPYGFRIEVEGGYAQYDFDTAKPFSSVFTPLNGSALNLQSGGSHTQYSATFNGFYDLPISGWIVPYIGGGIGANWTDEQTAVFTGPGGTPKFTQKAGNAQNAVALAEAGLTIAINEKWFVVPSYRFEKVLTNGNAFPNQANIFKLGVRYAL
jgi:opacity protein-like surface antigen